MDLGSIDIGYQLSVVWGLLRIGLWFFLLYGALSVVFMPDLAQKSVKDRIFYAWVGLNSVLMVLVFFLIQSRLYDFISLIFSALAFLVIRYFIRHRKEGVIYTVYSVEKRLALFLVRFIERLKAVGWRKKRDQAKKPSLWSRLEVGCRIVAVLILAAGGFTRLIPVFINAAPFNRNWYFDLENVKDLPWQVYFGDYPEPAGMHVLVGLFSTLTQVSPELILHLLGAVISTFICVMIYWAIQDLAPNSRIAPLFGMALYALVPTLLMPISLNQQIEANTLDFALCFAIPTLVFLIRRIKGGGADNQAYILAGYVATGLTNVFIFVILSGCLFFLIACFRKRVRTGYWLVRLIPVGLLLQAPAMIHCWTHGIEPGEFYRGQLFASRIFSFYPNLLLDMDRLGLIYMTLAAGVGTLCLVGYYFQKDTILRDAGLFSLFFALMSIPYYPDFGIGYVWIDVDQLNPFYAVLIAVFGGVLFAMAGRTLFEVRQWLHNRQRDDAADAPPAAADAVTVAPSTAVRRMEWLVLAAALAGLLTWQGGFQYSTLLPNTLPNGFFQAYYRIIDDLLPYSYATVGPEIDRTMAQNRHFFMNYDYLLHEYGLIDSLYHQYLLLPEEPGLQKTIPPASIFVFVEKPVSNSIQQGILYNAPVVMRQVTTWLDDFARRPGRQVNMFYETDTVAIYEIVNKSTESRVSDILWQIRPQEKVP